MKPIFQCQEVRVKTARIPDLALGCGDCGGWQVEDAGLALEMLDAILGLSAVEAGSVRWFGEEVSGLSEAKTLGLLARTMTLTADGPLIANLNIRDNILLPALHRRKDSESALLEKLDRLLAAPDLPWAVPDDFARRLPHQLGMLQRWIAAALRADLADPEIIMCCHYPGELSRPEQERLAAGLRWLQHRHAGAAWLFLTASPELPTGFDGPIAEIDL